MPPATFAAMNRQLTGDSLQTLDFWNLDWYGDWGQVIQGTLNASSKRRRQSNAFSGPLVHDVPGLVNLFGIESPGLTSSLAIGEYVSRMLLKK